MIALLFQDRLALLQALCFDTFERVFFFLGLSTSNVWVLFVFFLSTNECHICRL